jgi:hypothetical protein
LPEKGQAVKLRPNGVRRVNYPRTVLERLFHLSDNRTTVRTEIVAGFTTFLTMAYILFVQPTVLQAAGMDPGAVLIATCLGSGIATLLMALLANYPIAVAPAMGHNFFFAFTVVVGMQVPWQVALGAVAIAGSIFIVTAGVGLRERLIIAIPDALKHAIAVGIGLLVALIGLEWGGLVVASPGTLVTLGNLKAPPVLLTIFGLFVMAALLARRVRGALLLGILASTIVGLATGLVRYHGIVSVPPSISPTLARLDIAGAFAPAMIPVIFVFFFLALFDSVGTLVGVAPNGGRFGVGGGAPGAPRRRRRARDVDRNRLHRKLHGRLRRRTHRTRQCRHRRALLRVDLLFPARAHDRRRICSWRRPRVVSGRRSRADSRRHDDDAWRAHHQLGRSHGSNSGVPHNPDDAPHR